MSLGSVCLLEKTRSLEARELSHNQLSSPLGFQCRTRSLQPFKFEFQRRAASMRAGRSRGALSPPLSSVTWPRQAQWFPGRPRLLPGPLPALASGWRRAAGRFLLSNRVGFSAPPPTTTHSTQLKAIASRQPRLGVPAFLHS